MFPTERRTDSRARVRARFLIIVFQTSVLRLVAAAMAEIPVVKVPSLTTLRQRARAVAPPPPRERLPELFPRARSCVSRSMPEPATGCEPDT